MKEDPEFNISFVASIERYPCIYDYTSSDYSKKHIQDKAWETIATEASETVQDCKDRWKNVRGCYTRYLKSLNAPSGSKIKMKKPYYLTDYLHFLKPFTKSRHSKGSTTSRLLISPPETEPFQEEIDERYISEPKDPEVDQDDPLTNGNNNFTTPTPKRIRKVSKKSSASIEDINTSEFVCFPSRKTYNTEAISEDPDLTFMISILPDMKEMNNHQKRLFKVGILNLAEHILDDCKPSISPALSSSST